MDKQEKKLFAFQPTDYGQYSFFVMAAECNIMEIFDSVCSNDYVGFGTGGGYKLILLGRGEVIRNAND